MAARRKGAAAQLKSAEYEVGYGRPPKHSQFGPGQSGNPAGRPRGSKNRASGLPLHRFSDVIIEEAYRSITVSENGRSVTMPVAQAFMRSLGVSALKGQARAQKLFADLLAATERKNRAEHVEYVKALFEYKTAKRKALDSCREQGIPAPEFLPHPDDIVIDVVAGTFEVCGPTNQEQLEVWEELASLRDQAADMIKYRKTELEAEENDDRRAELRESIAHFELELSMVRDVIGEWPKHQSPSYLETGAGENSHTLIPAVPAFSTDRLDPTTLSRRSARNEEGPLQTESERREQRRARWLQAHPAPVDAGWADI
jgi:hypothetical protein